MLLFRNSSTVSLFLLCRVRAAQPSRLHKRSRVRSTQFSTCCCAEWRWSVFLQVHSFMPDDRPERKRKGSSKNRNAMWKTYSWLKILQVSKMKTKNRFQAIASVVRECAVCLHRSFAALRWVDQFLDGTDIQIDRGVTRLDGAWGKKQVWRPHFRTWGLPETNALYWRMYVWHCWAFWRPRNHSAPPQYFSAPRVIWPRVIAPPLPHRYPPVDWTIMQRVKSYKC